jgi:fructoselysine-6-phosphate deglycase
LCIGLSIDAWRTTLRPFTGATALAIFNFDEKRFLRIQSGAVALARGIDLAVGELLADGANCVFFVGTGGAGILMQPAVQFLSGRSDFVAFLNLPAEIVLTGHALLGPKSIVVIPSLSGTTKESIAALEYCKSRGAKIISLVGHADTPLGKGADYAFVNFAEDDTSCESFYLQSLLIALSIVKHRGEYEHYKLVLSELKRLPASLVEVKLAFEAKAERFAETAKSEPYHIITGAGSTWPQACYYGMCILEEMQWIRTRPVHAADFFHGTLELLDKDVSLIVFKGEDALRPLVERVEAFASQHTEKLHVFDTAHLATPGVGIQTRELISPVLLATVLERVSAHLEVKRSHPLTTRRYYKRVPY